MKTLPTTNLTTDINSINSINSNNIHPSNTSNTSNNHNPTTSKNANSNTPNNTSSHTHTYSGSAASSVTTVNKNNNNAQTLTDAHGPHSPTMSDDNGSQLSQGSAILDSQHLESGVLSQAMEDDDVVKRETSKGSGSEGGDGTDDDRGHDNLSQQTLDLSQLETYADGQPSRGDPLDVGSDLRCDEQLVDSQGRSVVPTPRGPNASEEELTLDHEVGLINGGASSTRAAAAAAAATEGGLRISVRTANDLANNNDPSSVFGGDGGDLPPPSSPRTLRPSPDPTRQTPVHDKINCLNALNGILGAASALDQSEMQLSSAIGPSHFPQDPPSAFPPSFGRADSEGFDLRRAKDGRPLPTAAAAAAAPAGGGGRNSKRRGGAAAHAKKAKRSSQAQPSSPSTSGFSPPNSLPSSPGGPPSAAQGGPGETVPDSDLLNASDSEILALALRDHRTKKHLLLEMALSRDNPRTSLHDPKPGVITEGFFWGNYPSLEKVLRARMDEYYELSTSKRQSKEQQTFNNRLVTKVRDVATASGWTFDGRVFDDKKIRDRIRCFFKTHIQNAKKRLKTVLKNQHKKPNAMLVASARDAVQSVVCAGRGAASAVKLAERKRRGGQASLEGGPHHGAGTAKRQRSRKAAAATAQPRDAQGGGTNAQRKRRDGGKPDAGFDDVVAAPLSSSSSSRRKADSSKAAAGNDYLYSPLPGLASGGSSVVLGCGIGGLNLPPSLHPSAVPRGAQPRFGIDMEDDEEKATRDEAAKDLKALGFNLSQGVSGMSQEVFGETEDEI